MTAPGGHAAAPVLDLDDIQGTLLRRRPDDYHGIYLLYEIADPAAARESLRRALPEITSAAAWNTPRAFTLNVAFSYSGLKAIGLPAESLASFPGEFRVGMAARSAALGDTGPNHPSGWREPLGSSSLHIGVLIIASAEEALAEPAALASELGGLKIIDRLPVSVPVTGREHFGFRDGIGGPYIIGSTEEPLPGHDPIMPGEFILGYEDETGKIPAMPSPDTLGRNGTFMAFRQLSCDVASFRRFLKDHARTPGEEELIAAKMVGR